MQKIIFTAIFIFTLIFQNIASAVDPNSIDWDAAPRFGDRQSFMNYIHYCEDNCQSVVPVVFTNGLFVNVEECLKIAKNSQYVHLTWWNDSKGKPYKALYELSIYPGARVAYAYQTGNTSILTADERQLYDTAVQIVNVANQLPTALMKEHYIHETITRIVTYYTTKTNDNMPRHCNALGALLDGKANCQGYTDSFYMLGRMLGFNVGKMSGRANNEGHVWNTITFGDGKIYAVDVTWNDASFAFADSREYNNYIYFNAPLEIMRTTHSWETFYNPTLYPNVDERYFYFAPEFSNTNGRFSAFNSSTAEGALDSIAQRIARDGWQLSWGISPYNAKYADVSFSLNRLVHEILPKKYNWYGSVKMSIARRGNWLYYTVDAKKNN